MSKEIISDVFEKHLQTVVQVVATAILLWGGATLVELRTAVSVLSSNVSTLTMQLTKMEAKVDKNADDLAKVRDEQLRRTPFIEKLRVP